MQIHNFPDGITTNKFFEVRVRELSVAGSCQDWQELPCRLIYTGRQMGQWDYSGLCLIDFDDELEFEIAWKGSDLEEVDIRPHSYGILPKVDRDKGLISFKVKQDRKAPKKIFVRINDGWGREVLHILSNPVEREESIPNPCGKNVLRIRPGDPIPEILPAGVDTYYFDRGFHILPKGLWAIVDLEDLKEVDEFVLSQSNFTLSDCQTGEENFDPLAFTIEARKEEGDIWDLLYDGRDNDQKGLIRIKVQPHKCRQIRLRLLGTTLKQGWIFSSLVNSFQVYGPDKKEDLALGKATDGAIPDYKNLTDGDPNSFFTGQSRSASWHAGESFFIARDKTNIYLAPGANVCGSITGDGVSDIKISGRGVLDGSYLHHENPQPGEARSGAIWITGGRNIHVEGITILDAPMWQVVLNYNKQVLVKDINLIGFTVNADGVHLSGSEDALVTGSFIRSCDDLIVMYHYGRAKNIAITNCVFMNEDAHVFLFGLGDNVGASISDVEINNCDIISQIEAPWVPYRFSGVFKLWAHGRNIIENISISNIRLDPFQDPAKGCFFQFRTEHRFDGEVEGRAIRNISFSDIYLEGEKESPSLLSAHEGDSFIENVSFHKIYRNGRPCQTLDEIGIDIEGNVKDVKLIDEA